MTVSSTERIAGPFTRNGSQVDYPFTMRVFADTDILATQTTVSGTVVPLVLGSDYTVAVNADQRTSPGGTLTMLDAGGVAGETLDFTTSLQATQGARLTNAGGFYPQVIEDALDKITILLQQMGIFGNQGLRAPFPEVLDELPSWPERLGLQLLFHPVTGQPYLAAPVSGSAADVLTSLADYADPAKGPALVGLGAALNYPANTVGAGLRGPVAMAGGVVVGDGTTSATAAVAAAAKEYLREYVATAHSNPRGANLTPDGFIHNTTLGRVYNPPLQRMAMSFGQEYLHYWFTCFDVAANQNNGDTTIRAVVLSGDSTTYGVGSTKATPATILDDAAEARGYTNVGVINHGQSGKATFDWIATHLAGDLAATPDLLILRWGANDPFFGRTADQFLADLRTGLATIRASRDVSELSVLLCTPNSMNNVEMGADQAFFEQINQGVRQAARDYQCAFLDIYNLLQASHDGVNVWMDGISFSGGPNRAVHPGDTMYEHIAGYIAEMIYPDWGRDWKANSVRNTSGGDALALRESSDLPVEYFSGIGMHRMGSTGGTAAGGPYNGAAYTFKQADGVALQISVPLLGGGRGPGVSMRMAWANAWGIWLGQEIAGSALLVNGWTATSGVKNFTYQTAVEGRVILNGNITAGTTADGTILATLPAGYRPHEDEVFVVGTGAATMCRIRIGTDGTIKLYSWPGGTYLCFGGLSFRLAA